MSPVNTTRRSERVNETRELILTAAERLFAEHGVAAVSNRQVGEAAGQGNNFAVGYHFGGKTELVRAIVRKHTDQIERLRQEQLAEPGDETDLRTWVARLVRPSTNHLAELGIPSWFARFSAQMITDPALCQVMYEETISGPGLVRIIDGLNRTLPTLPPEVRLERGDMARNLIAHMSAEHERALADGTPTTRPTWHDMASGLIDAITGLLLAPVTTNEERSR